MAVARRQGTPSGRQRHAGSQTSSSAISSSMFLDLNIASDGFKPRRPQMVSLFSSQYLASSSSISVILPRLFRILSIVSMVFRRIIFSPQRTRMAMRCFLGKRSNMDLSSRISSSCSRVVGYPDASSSQRPRIRSMARRSDTSPKALSSGTLSSAATIASSNLSPTKLSPTNFKSDCSITSNRMKAIICWVILSRYSGKYS
mmetsp:Transcript_66572/g.179979  ORF Transcript_66572/g.179979 Transcript_66572/m.179979 type:complete len:201 (+) Transcript_66572:86-688(+)